MVNGAPMTTHSLTFANPEQYDKIKQLTEGPDALPHGSEIILDDPPLAVNMIIDPSLDDKPVTSRRQRQLDALREYSLPDYPDKIVVPLVASKSFASSGSQKTSKWTSYLTSDRIFPLASAVLSDVFPYELAFAMTVHKAQGRTIHRVVADLHAQACPKASHEFAAVFVAMSRVRKASHLRLLPRSSFSTSASL